MSKENVVSSAYFATLEGAIRDAFVSGVGVGGMCNDSLDGDILAIILGDDRKASADAVREVLLNHERQRSEERQKTAKYLIDLVVNSGEEAVDDLLHSVRSLIMNVDCCKKDGHIYNGTQRLDDAKYSLKSGTNTAPWAMYMAYDPTDNRMCTMEEYEGLSEDVKKRCLKTPCIFIEAAETGPVPIGVNDQHYLNQLITMDMETNPNTRILYAINIGSASKNMDLVKYNNVIAGWLSTTGSPFWNKAVVTQIKAGEINGAAHLALAILESFYRDQSMLKDASEETIQDCITMLSKIGNVGWFTDAELQSYRNSGVPLQGCKKDKIMPATEKATVGEQREYAKKIISDVAWALMHANFFTTFDTPDNSELKKLYMKLSDLLKAFSN